MPTRVQNRPAELPHNQCEKFTERDSTSNVNRSIQLRLALGTILAPKRPYTPSSHSSSGTSSPAQPSSLGGSISPGLPPTPTPNPTTLDGRSDNHLHPRIVFAPHTPSRLGQSDAKDAKEPNWPAGSPPASTPSSAPVSPQQGTQSSLAVEDCPSLSLPPPVVEQQPPKRPSIHASKAASAPNLGVASPAPSNPTGSGSRTPRSKFLETLESKSAWDALIHGSFS